MRRLRQRLAWIVGAWLVFQTSALMAAPVSMCAGAMVSVPEQSCTCALGGAMECPTHHRAMPNPKSSCSCRSAADTSTAAVAALLGPIAVLPPAIGVAVLFRSTHSMPSIVATPIDGLTLPDAPPPRA
jgi:hypothetical protein